MLCSAQAGKSASNWLDRLRSNRGIPTGDDLDLDSFLARISSDSFADQTHSAGKIPTRSSEISAAADDAHPTLRSVLAELFNFGGSISRSSNLIGKKKCPRKQTNPKFFVASSPPNSICPTIDDDRFARGGKVNDNNNNNDNNALAANSFDDVDNAAELKLKEEKNKNMDYCCDIEEEEKDDGGNELRGFSKSEVTVIDTSCPGWKAEKIVFRKNNVWKVRERKGKSKSLAKKKTKGSFGFANHKKEATKGLEYQSGSSSENDKAEFVTPSSTTPVRAYDNVSSYFA